MNSLNAPLIFTALECISYAEKAAPAFSFSTESGLPLSVFSKQVYSPQACLRGVTAPLKILHRSILRARRVYTLPEGTIL
jgi:hypothetical protein